MCLLALVRDEYWLKLAGRERSRENRERVGNLWRVGKSKEVGFKVGRKLITGEGEFSARVGRSRADVCGGVVCVRSKGS